MTRPGLHGALQELRALETECARELDTLRNSIAVIARICGQDGAVPANGHQPTETNAPDRETKRRSLDTMTKKPGTKRPKGEPLEGEALRDRILVLVRGAAAGLKRKELEADVHASDYSVHQAMTELLTSGEIVALGNTTSRRYATPAVARDLQVNR